MAINVAIIGCGLIGKKRAAQLQKKTGAKIIYAVDQDLDQAHFLASSYSCKVASHWEKVIGLPEIDAVIIATPNYLSAVIAKEALRQQKHVLIEKPFGKNIADSLSILQEATSSSILKTGFNHRFHPAIAKAKKLVDAETIGSIFSMRARYGHGGRPGMEREWRASKELCGGGELLDQGIHIIDLMRWFGGEWTEVYGKLDTAFWPIEVEDNAYVLGKIDHRIHAMFHVSWTEWKNHFSFELFGSKGSIHIEGLGGNYGQESLTINLRPAEGGKPETTKILYPEEDVSWGDEWEEFTQAILEKRRPLGDGKDGLEANRVIDAIIQSQHQNKRVMLHA